LHNFLFSTFCLCKPHSFFATPIFQWCLPTFPNTTHSIIFSPPHFLLHLAFWKHSLVLIPNISPLLPQHYCTFHSSTVFPHLSQVTYLLPFSFNNLWYHAFSSPSLYSRSTRWGRQCCCWQQRITSTPHFHPCSALAVFA
jgi:hypothetical protein